MIFLSVNIVVELYVLNGTIMEVKSIEFNAFLEVICEPDLYQAIFVSSCQKLPSIHVNGWTNYPFGDFFIIWQLNWLFNLFELLRIN